MPGISITCPRSNCRRQIRGDARFCARCGHRLPRAWYQIGRLGRTCSVWANCLLIAMGPLTWLLWRHRPAGSIAFDIGVFLGVATATFGECGGAGWMVSSIAWRMGRYSQATAMTAFTAAAGLLLILNLIANSRVTMVRAAPGRLSGITRLQPLPPVRFAPQRRRPANAPIPVTMDLDLPAATQPAMPQDLQFSPLDLFAVLAVVNHTGPIPSADELQRLARGYFTGKMPPGLCQVYEQALLRGLLPDPRVGWTDVARFDRWKRADELIKASHQREAAAAPTLSPAADIDGDLPKDVFLKIKVLKARDEFGDMHGIIQRPDGWVISSVQIAIFPSNRPESRKIFTTGTWARPDEPSNILHLYIRNVRGEFSGLKDVTGFTWTVIHAKGHRSS